MQGTTMSAGHHMAAVSMKARQATSGNKNVKSTANRMSAASQVPFARIAKVIIGADSHDGN